MSWLGRGTKQVRKPYFSSLKLLQTKRLAGYKKTYNHGFFIGITFLAGGKRGYKDITLGE
jgi:hypothetical protein